MVRGIGDPLVACYARAYLSRVGMSVAPETKNHLMPNFKDYLKTVDQVQNWYRIGAELVLELYRTGTRVVLD